MEGLLRDEPALIEQLQWGPLPISWEASLALGSGYQPTLNVMTEIADSGWTMHRTYGGKVVH